MSTAATIPMNPGQHAPASPAPAPSRARRTPGIILPPPVVFLASLVTGVVLDSAFGRPFVPGGHVVPARVATGLLLAAFGVWLARSAHRHFVRAGVNPLPWRPVTAIVRDGPFRWSRNPMYLGMAVSTFGLCIATGSFWGLLNLIPACALVHLTAVKREERYLESRFGEDYLTYRRSARRYI